MDAPAFIVGAEYLAQDSEPTRDQGVARYPHLGTEVGVWAVYPKEGYVNLVRPLAGDCARRAICSHHPLTSGHSFHYDSPQRPLGYYAGRNRRAQT
jgi:hypothetical protein